jgi:hypothetical protein
MRRRCDVNRSFGFWAPIVCVRFPAERSCADGQGFSHKSSEGEPKGNLDGFLARWQLSGEKMEDRKTSAKNTERKQVYSRKVEVNSKTLSKACLWSSFRGDWDGCESDEREEQKALKPIVNALQRIDELRRIKHETNQAFPLSEDSNKTEIAGLPNGRWSQNPALYDLRCSTNRISQCAKQ